MQQPGHPPHTLAAAHRSPDSNNHTFLNHIVPLSVVVAVVVGLGVGTVVAEPAADVGGERPLLLLVEPEAKPTRELRWPTASGGERVHTLAREYAAPGGRVVDQVATVTCAPNADVRDIHHRMGVILAPEQFDTWLMGDADAAAELLAPLPDGSLAVEVADDVDWDAR